MASQTRSVDNIVSAEWVDPNQAFTENGLCTHFATKNGANVYNIINTPFTIPEGVTIDGIEVKTIRGTDADDYYTIELQTKAPAWKLKNGTSYQAVCADGAPETLGGAMDLWDGSWDAVHINSSSFQVRITFKASGKANTIYVDHIEITVYYTEIGTGILSIDTTPVKGEVFVEAESWGTAPQLRELPVGFYDVSFGEVLGYATPDPVVTEVKVDETTEVLGTYLEAWYCTLNGTIEATEENCDERGFDWGIESGNYTEEWTEAGSYGVGSFSHQITGLDLEKTYYFRAKAHNPGGWGYGEEKTAYFDIGVIEASADLLTEFVVGQDSTDLFAKYSVHREDSANLLCKLTVGVLSSSAELLGKFKARHLTTTELLGRYGIRQPGSTEIPAKTKIRQLASTELLGKFIFRQGITSELLGKGIIRHTDAIELLWKVDIQHSDSSELLVKGIITNIDSVDLLAEFVVGQDYSSGLFANCVIRQEISANLLGKSVIRTTGSVEFFGKFTVGILASSAELPGKFEVRPGRGDAKQPGSAEISAKTEIRRSGATEILGKLVLRLPSFADLLGKLIVGYSASASLLARSIIRCAGSVNLLSTFSVGHFLTQSPLGKFTVRHTATPVDLLGKCDIGKLSTSKALLGKFAVKHTATLDLLGKKIVRHIGTPVELLANAEIKNIDSAELSTKTDIRHSGLAEAYGHLIARNIGAAELLGKTVIRHSDSEELLGRFRTSTPDWLTQGVSAKAYTALTVLK